MMLAFGVAQPPFIVDIENDENNPATLLDGADSTVATAHYKAKANRAEQLKRRKKVQSS